MEGLLWLWRKARRCRSLARWCFPSLLTCPPARSSGGVGGVIWVPPRTPGTHRARAEGSLLHSWHCRGAASPPAL